MKSDADYRGTEATKECPYLGNFSNPSDGVQFMVLFYGPRAGVVVDAGTSIYPLGYNYSLWLEDTFKRIPGNKVTLTNE